MTNTKAFLGWILLSMARMLNPTILIKIWMDIFCVIRSRIRKDNAGTGLRFTGTSSLTRLDFIKARGIYEAEQFKKNNPTLKP
jgi:hypothetical protein